MTPTEAATKWGRPTVFAEFVILKESQSVSTSASKQLWTHTDYVHMKQLI